MKRLACLCILLMAFVQILNAQGNKPVLAFASDTQEPMWVEKLFLRSNHNLLATNMIFQDVDSLRPKAFFILGDVVSLGKSKKAWKNIDRYLSQLVKDSVPVYATLGNHEVMFNAKKGTLNFKKRFADYNPSGYTEVIDSVAVVLLNSNFAQMAVPEITQQNTWYQAKLNALDNDPAIKLIIVGCHHSPYTNSSIVSPSEAVRKNFVPPFVKSTKAVLFLSGHSHNFESFKMLGKNFLVIGGGGGLHQPLKANNPQ
jgi:predicted MPP superfamily phosphohydrolase